MTNSDFDEIIKPSKSYRRSSNFDIKEYNHIMYIKKKNMRKSKTFTN